MGGEAGAPALEPSSSGVEDHETRKDRSVPVAEGECQRKGLGPGADDHDGGAVHEGDEPPRAP
jgi:hypothetical protein